MKRIAASLLLCAALIFGCCACTATDGPGMVNYSVQGNLLKIEGKSGLLAGKLDGLELSEEGGAACLVLKDGAQEGTFTSPEYMTDDFTHMVASWNAFIYEGGSVEILARAKFGGTWTDWLTWGEFTPYASRGSIKNKKCDTAYVDVDTFILKDGEQAHHVQVMAVLRRDEEHPDAKSPELRRVCMTFAGGTMLAAYAEEPVEELPVKALCPAPGISQEIRYRSIADSICSPTTMTVMMLSRESDPQAQRYAALLPEMYALMTEDNAEDMFGNWSYTCSGAGLYGYECYCQYAGKDILMQELAKGHTCGINVVYSNRKSDGLPYLKGCAGSTNGHLITIIGYEYEDGQIDDEHLYFYSSDSYSDSDDTCYRRYKWTELAQCWTKRIAYIIPSLEREAVCTDGPFYHIAADLEPAGNNEYRFVCGVNGDGSPAYPDTYDFERGDGFVAWCVDNICTDNTAGGVASDSSVVYEKPMQVYANNTFSYAKMAAGGKVKIDREGITQRAAEQLGIAPEDVFITVFAISPNGYCYTAGVMGGEPVSSFAVEN
ncbi:MAG: C39 family peptidase [Firmicutes bacterium]|nr:C39 family peptidase [Bacillota bacterium]